MIENIVSTTSELMQDNSLSEYVSSETNPTTTVQNNELIFGQKHNDIDCALCPTAKRACDRAWVTAKQIENWSGMSKMTLWRWLEKLEKARRIATVSDMIQWQMPHEHLCSPSGRATFWTKCMTKTKRSLESTETSEKKSRFELFPFWK